MDEEVLNRTRAWLEKAVIGLNLCPFAKAVFVKNQVRMVVSHARHIDDALDELERELSLLQQTPADEIDTTLLIHPTLFPDFEVFNDCMALADEVLLDNDWEGIFQLAHFHPQFQFAGTEVDDITNATNRAPFATLHLLREDSITRGLEAYAKTEPELTAQQIVERNLQTLRDLGPQAWHQLMS